MRFLIAILAGIFFGLGLTISNMVNPKVVLDFLDIAGSWNPALAFVLGGAVMTSVVAWQIRNRRLTPVLGGEFPNAASGLIDKRLIIGSGLFGIGWGLVGICPGPAITAISFGGVSLLIFIASMFAGMFLNTVLNK